MELPETFDQPARRRCWLLAKALESTNFEEALDLARAAEDFIASHLVLGAARGPRPSPATAGPATPTTGDAAPPAPAALNSAPQSEAPASPRRRVLAIGIERRERLIERLAEGAGNAPLAAEFGLTPKQVQGVRMGAARAIAARRRARGAAVPASPPEGADEVADVVRYLRRQDDVVVGQKDGSFLVNGRFRLEFPELVARANRMLERQKKPLFQMSQAERLAPGIVAAVETANGHAAL